jgi:hypothetical protein
MDEWVIKVEKRLISIQKDIEFIKTALTKHNCDKIAKINSTLRAHKWTMTLLFGAIFTILGTLITSHFK